MSESTFSVSEKSEVLNHARLPHNTLTCTYKNRTGAASVKGSLVCTSTSYDDAVELSEANDTDVIGVMVSDGVPDGEDCIVAVAGKAQVLLKDSTAATRGNWVKTSNAPGRADATTGSPPGGDISHWQEIGHCAESKGADTDVLCWVHLHFN